MDEAKRIRLLDAMLRIMPDFEIGREMRAAQNEEWGCELLLTGGREDALEKFQACAEEKKAILANREKNANSEEEQADVVKRRLELARNYLGIAILARSLKRLDAACLACETTLAILAETRVADETTGAEIAAIREEAELILKKL